VTDSSRFKGVSVKDPVSGESSIRRNSRTRLFIAICCTQDSRPLQRSGRDPTRTISTIENKKRQIRQFFESVFPKPRRSMDILLCMLPTKRRIPSGKFILHVRAIGKHPMEGDVTNNRKMWIQSQHQTRDHLRADGIWRSKFPEIIRSTRNRSSPTFLATLENTDNSRKIAPMRR